MRDKDKEQTRYRDKMYEIRLLNCSFRKINITTNNSEDKYYIVPQNILNNIFSIREENEIFKTNYVNTSIINKYLGENYKSILSAKEANIIAEEEKMKDKADIVDDETKNNTHKNGLIMNKTNIIPTNNIINKDKPIKIIDNIPNNNNDISKKEDVERHISMNPNLFNRLKTFQKMFNSKDNNTSKKEIKEEKNENGEKDIKMQKKLSHRYIFPKGIYSAINTKKRVSIANLNELNQNRFDNISREIIRRRTINLGKYN